MEVRPTLCCCSPARCSTAYCLLLVRLTLHCTGSNYSAAVSVPCIMLSRLHARLLLSLCHEYCHYLCAMHAAAVSVLRTLPLSLCYACCCCLSAQYALRLTLHCASPCVLADGKLSRREYEDCFGLGSFTACGLSRDPDGLLSDGAIDKAAWLFIWKSAKAQRGERRSNNQRSTHATVLTDGGTEIIETFGATFKDPVCRVKPFNPFDSSANNYENPFNVGGCKALQRKRRHSGPSAQAYVFTRGGLSAASA